MNVLFLCLSRVWDIHEQSIYTDLLNEWVDRGDHVYIVSPIERRFKEKTTLLDQGNAKILKVHTLNIQKTNFLEKGIGTLLLEWQYLHAIKRHFKDIRFDMVLCATPPITLVRPIEYVKRRDGARSYLLLKDIFPQNAVDLGIMSTSGIRSLPYRIFRKAEKKLYAVSDRIGCMSEANAAYLLRHNPEIDAGKVEVCPNSYRFADLSVSPEEKKLLRQKYGLPPDKKIFVFGGNIGIPHDVPFMIRCIRAMQDTPEAFFFIVGDGTEYGKFEAFVAAEHPTNVKLMNRLPREEYDKLAAACDIGMIFLDHRFTVPNFPSRLISYMQVGLPTLACTDTATDIGSVITRGGFGWWCESNDTAAFKETAIRAMRECSDETLRSNTKTYLRTHFTSENDYHIIMRSK